MCNSFYFKSTVSSYNSYANTDNEKGINYFYYKTNLTLTHALKDPVSSIELFYTLNDDIKIKTPLLLKNLNPNMVHVIIMNSMFGYPSILDKSLYNTLTGNLQIVKFEGESFEVKEKSKVDTSYTDRNLFCIDKQSTMKVICYNNSYSNLSISYSNSYLLLSNVTNMTEDFIQYYRNLYDSDKNKDFVFNTMYQRDSDLNNYISSKICPRIIFANPNSFVNSYFMDNDMFNDSSIKSSTVCDFAQFPLETRFLTNFNYIIFLFYHTENKQIIFHLDIIENHWNTFSSKRVYYSDTDFTYSPSRRILRNSFNRQLLTDDQKYNDMVNLANSKFTQVNGNTFYPNVFKFLNSNLPKLNKELLVYYNNSNVTTAVGNNYFLCFYLNMKTSVSIITPPFTFNFKYFNENSTKSYLINHIFYPASTLKEGYLLIKGESASLISEFKELYSYKNIGWVHYCFNFFKQSNVNTFFNETIYSSYYGSKIEKKGTFELKASGLDFPQFTLQLTNLKRDFKLANLLLVNIKTNSQDSSIYQKLRYLNYNSLSYFSIMFPICQDFTFPLIKSWDLISNYDHYETDSFYLENIYLNSNLNEYMYVFQDGYPKFKFHNGLFDVYVRFDGEFLLKNCFSSNTNFISDVKFIINDKEIASFDINLKSQTIYSVFNLQSTDNIISIIVRVDLFIQTFLFYTNSYVTQNTYPSTNNNNGFISRISSLQTMYVKSYETIIRRVPNKSISNYIMLVNDVSFDSPSVDLVNNIYSENWSLLEKAFPSTGLINTKCTLLDLPTQEINKNTIKFSHGLSKNFNFWSGYLKGFLVSRYIFTSNYLNSFNYFPMITTINSNYNNLDSYYNLQTNFEYIEVFLSKNIVSNSNSANEGRFNVYVRHPSPLLLMKNNIIFNYPYPDLFIIKAIEHLDNTLTIFKLEIREDQKIKENFAYYNYVKIDYNYKINNKVLTVNFLSKSFFNFS